MAEPECVHQGKVRDVYAWKDTLILVATDRISAFDVVLPTPIPQKGIALTQMSRYWFDHLPDFVPGHHLGFSLPTELTRPDWEGRVTWCRRAQVIPMECVVRGYLAGSGWTAYRQTGTLQGHQLPPGLLESEKLPEPLFTPTTKAQEGHDHPLTEPEARAYVGDSLFEHCRELSIGLYGWAHTHAESKGLILADTKFEFGWVGGDLTLIDECLTPDSSRYWSVDEYEPGRPQNAFDKQFVRDYLRGLCKWDQSPPGPELPEEIVKQTRARYITACETITETPFCW